MKGKKLIFLISSILLLTISSGLLFYKNIFFLDNLPSDGMLNFEELKMTDLQLNASAIMLRKNLTNDSTQIEKSMNRLKELLNIILDINKNTPELKQSLKKIQLYFDHKNDLLISMQENLKELKSSLDSLNPDYNELIKKNLKFSVDKKDFYLSCLTDSLLYLSSQSKENEMRVLENKKIMSQIIAYANSPNPTILKYSNDLESIYKNTHAIDKTLESFMNDNSINHELNIVGKYYKESQDSRQRDSEIFLTMVYGAVFLYLFCLIVILRRLS